MPHGEPDLWKVHKMGQLILYTVSVTWTQAEVNALMGQMELDFKKGQILFCTHLWH